MNQFITWQLAGDLFHNATKELNLGKPDLSKSIKSPKKEGVVDEEYRSCKVTDPNPIPSAKSLLGITMECAGWP